MLKLYIGYDPAEKSAYDALVNSLEKHSNIRPEPLCEDRLRSSGLYSRMIDKRGQYYDFPSNAPCSTEFASSRFLVPLLCQSGWALFVDCDMIFFVDPLEIMQHADPDKAVMVVKHSHHGEGTKMCGMVQTAYHRKNWSSVMLFNCDHPANQRLSVRDINDRPGRDLHRFYWLHDDEIGELPGDWNWLVNVQEKPASPKIAHFTNGGPWFKDWEPQPYDEIWHQYAR